MKPGPCAHAAACGGCALQHVEADEIAASKRDRVAAALRRAEVDVEELAPIWTAPERSRRRVKFAAVRTKKRVALGYMRRGSHEIVDIEDCLVARPEIVAAASDLRDLARLAAPRSKPIELHVTSSEDGLDILVGGGKALTAELRAEAAGWAATADAARLTWGDELIAGRRPPRHRFGAALATPPAGGFLQASAEAEARMVAEARSALAGARRIADLFCGVGAFALPLAESAEMLAVDSEAASIEALDAAWRRASGLKRMVATARDLFRRPLTAAELKGVDAAVFDPPRAGAKAQATALAGADLQKIVGVSCDPNSFARDARILADAGWRLRRVAPIDQFLWTPHVELVGVFDR